MGDTLDKWPAQKRRESEITDAQIVTTACGTCGEVLVQDALLGDARSMFRAHVEVEHPELLPALDRKRLPKAIPTKKESDHAMLRRLDLIAGAAA